VPQSAIIAATLMGCDTVLARPPEMALDPEIITACQANAERNGSSFEITDDFKGAAKGAHVLYPKAWAATPIFKPPVGKDDLDKAQEIFDRYKGWKATREYMELGDRNAIYMHCLPADRAWECANEVIDNTDPQSGWRSVVYDEAENRLHVQKAVMALTM
jgi:N-acetylornithine carbamoyltransferase